MCKLSHYGNCDPETEEEEYCIFHRPNKNEKEAEEFWRKFFDRFKPEEEKIEIGRRKIRRFIFKEDVYCSGYVFPASFKETETAIAKPFRYSVFKGSVNFSEARFEGYADFSEARFEGYADFSGAIFLRDAFFSGAKFEVGACFIETKIKGFMYFFGAKFEGYADFSEARFEGYVSFSWTIFSGDVDFSEATFSIGANFSMAEFEGYADFSEARFEGYVSFSNARFHNFVNFSKAKFPNLKEGNLEDLLSYASFRKVYFEYPKRAVFDGIEGKTKISFINTDISRVVFRNCSFDFLYDEFLLKNRKRLEKMLKDVEEKISSIKKSIKEGKNVDKEELRELEHYRKKLTRELENLTLDNVLSVIRMLRENFDYCMKYEESGRLFIKEMDLKRDYLLKRGAEKRRFADKISRYIEWFAYSLYRIMGLYGESIARPIFWIPVIIILFGVLRGLLSHPLFNGLHLSSLMRGIQESLEAFVQLRWDGSFLTLIERVISALNLGVLYISLHRKLERRIRH